MPRQAAQIVIVSMTGLPPAPDTGLGMNVEAGNFDERAAIPAFNGTNTRLGLKQHMPFAIVVAEALVRHLSFSLSDAVYHINGVLPSSTIYLSQLRQPAA